jgi:ATP-binding cassette subfamily C protein
MAWHYLTALVTYARLRLVWAFILLLCVGLTEGSGLLMLAPFLHVLGLTPEDGAPTGLSLAMRQGFSVLGLPLTLPVMLGLYASLVTCQAVLRRWCDVFMMEIQLSFVDHLRLRLYTAIGRANWLFLSQQRTADFTAILTADMARIGQGTHFFLDSVVSGLLMLVHILVACRLSVVMTLMALGTGGGLLAILWPQVRRARELGTLWTHANQDIFHTITEFFNGIKLAKSYNAEARYRDTFAVTLHTLRQRMIHFMRSSATVRMLYHIGATVALSILVYMAVVVVRLPTADLLVLVFVFARLLPILSKLQNSCQHFVHMLPSFAQAMAIEASCAQAAEDTPEHEVWTPGLRQEVRFQQVHFWYNKQAEQATLTDINLVIPVRQTTALVGPSGAGKSTLADLLIGLLSPDTGMILVDGEPLCHRRLPLWRRQVAYVPQETFLFHDTVRANLLWAQPAASEAALWQALHLAAAEQFVHQLPAGLDTVVGDRGIRLSGGERQRLALARALLYQPSLLILDEATSALDTEHERRIQQALDDLHGELTMVVIAHRLSTVHRADHIVVIDQGRVVEAGTWEALRTHTGGRLQALLHAATVA